jgi:polysaccharide biosynthesis transport protein
VTVSAPHEPAPLDLRQIFRVLMRRRWLLLLPWTAAIVAGVAAAFLLRPIYFSQVTMMLERPQQLAGDLGAMVGSGTSPDQQAEVMRQQVQSSTFLREIIEAAGLRDDPKVRAWALKEARRYTGMTPDQQVETFLTSYLRSAISVRRDKGDVFQVLVAEYEPERARRVAESVADQFVSSSKASQLETVRATQAFSIEQQQIYKRKLEEAEGRLEAATRAALGSGGATTLGSGDLPHAQGLAQQADIEVDEQQQKVASLRAELGGRARENDIQLLSSARVSVLVAQLADLERKLAASMLSTMSGDNGSGLRILMTRRYAELETELGQNAAVALPALSPDTRDLLVRIRMAQADLAAKRAGRDFLASQVGNYRAQVAMSPDRDLQVQRLKTEAENARTLYNSFVQQSAAAQITEAFENAKVGGRFVILEPATRPLSPGKPNRPLLIVLAFVLGGILGVGTVLVVEQHDESMKDAEEVENLLGLPVLGAVPRVEDLQRSSRRRGTVPSANASGPRDPGMIHRLKIESAMGLEFRRIYLKLAKTRGRSLPRSVLVTSATRGDGKTTTAACLAITLARELREKVLLVDYDLRSPALHRALGLPSSSWGVAQMLQQREFDERFIRATAVPGLDFLSAGKSERPAGELVDTAGSEWFMQEASARYAMVVLDAPPNLAVPDPLILGRAVEGVLYVIKAGSTVRKAAEYGVKVQREARDNVLGVLMNDVGEVMPQYYGYRSDTYGYSSEVVGGDS